MRQESPIVDHLFLTFPCARIRVVRTPSLLVHTIFIASTLYSQFRLKKRKA